MSNIQKIELSIDIDKIADALKSRAVDVIISNYFDAYDVDYKDQKRIKQERLEKIMKNVDWNKLPEEMQKSILGKFIDRYLVLKDY